MNLSDAPWFKSSYSGGGKECVEVAFLEANWFKSTHSGGGKDCVEIAFLDAVWLESSRSSAGKDCVEVAFHEEGAVGVRDSKNPTGPALVFTPTEWDAFTTELSTGKLNHL